MVFFMWKTTPCFKMSAFCVQEPWLSSLLSLLSFTHTHHKHYTQLLSHIFSFIHFIFLSYTLLSPSLCNVSSFPRVYLLFERVELSDWLLAIYLMSRWDYPSFCRENQGAKMRKKCNEPVMCGKHYSSLISHHKRCSVWRRWREVCNICEWKWMKQLFYLTFTAGWGEFTFYTRLSFICFNFKLSFEKEKLQDLRPQAWSVDEVVLVSKNMNPTGEGPDGITCSYRPVFVVFQIFLSFFPWFLSLGLSLTFLFYGDFSFHTHTLQLALNN